MLVQLAAVVPRGIAIGGRGPAVVLAAVLAVTVAIAIAGMLAAWGPRAFTSPPLALPLAVLIGSQLLAAALGVYWQAGAFEIGSQIGDTIGFFAFWWTMRDERTRRGVLGTYLVSGILASAFAIALTLSRHPPAEFAYEHGRAAGTFLQPNEFAGYLLFLIPVGIAQYAAPAVSRFPCRAPHGWVCSSGCRCSSRGSDAGPSSCIRHARSLRSSSAPSD